MSGFATRLREAMTRKGMGAGRLGTAAGLSRQAVYRMLRPDFDPFSRGLRAVALALDVDPVSLVPREDEPDARVAEVKALLRQAAQDRDARAFEVLPAALVRLDPAALPTLRPGSDLEIRLLAAAAALAGDLAGRPDLRAFAHSWKAHEDPCQAFIFGGRRIDPERAVARSPAAMRRHGVFGAFDIESFRRHLEEPARHAPFADGTGSVPPRGGPRTRPPAGSRPGGGRGGPTPVPE